MSRGHWQDSRKIVERVVVCGDLVLETPACFGNGDSDSLTDMPLALDPLEGRGLLTGTSIAGALRAYLREREFGYGRDGGSDALHNRLFGRQEDNEGEQSWVITYDALSESVPGIELRDGVAIDPETRTAESRKKFDFELLEAGTRFPLRVELLIPQDQDWDALLKGLAIALQGLENGEIRLGARKRRGLGQCRVTEWQVMRYDLTTPAGLLDWLNQTGTPQTGSRIADLLGVKADLDRREAFTVEATFGLDGSLLVRSGQGEAGAPDMVHLQSRRNGRLVPILSGTSLAGALRARALRIAQTIAQTVGTQEKATALVNALFGLRIRSSKDKPTASRLTTAEIEIGSPLPLVQTRVKIDRFTGGSFPTALFSEQPVWGRKDTAIAIGITIQQPTKAQIGLFLLLLKDLWTGDLPLGGEISVGRGRLRGQQATLTYKRPGNIQEWIIAQDDGQLTVQGDRKQLEQFVAVLVQEVGQ
ncbi:MAG TPA: RAMP superfamily CRISPR-associated protein [Methanothrix sp.]|nr:RAMP superfamily CRISPR-associated protein [Methanothrix sp.]